MNSKYKSYFTYVSTMLCLLAQWIQVQAQSHYPGQHQGKLALNDLEHTQLQAFDLSDIHLLESRFTENMQRESQWIMSLKVSQLLHSFQTNAGVYAGREGGYMTVEKLGGWESLDCELRGHSTGHILSGLSLLFATTGDEQYKQKGDSLVTGLAEVQKALNQNGYLSAYPQYLIDRNIAGSSVWAPWYTLHKLFAGLLDQYLYGDNPQALEIAEGMAYWAYQKLSSLTDEERKRMLKNEFGGINDSFYTLYELTGKEEYQKLGAFFYHNDVLEPLAQQEDILSKKHANTYIPKLIGLCRAYEIQGNESDRDISTFFWNTVVSHHSFITGSNSDKEKFFEPDHISEHLTGYTGESCNVYNMLKLTRHLYAYNPEIEYVDFYEKALYNHILGQQDTQTGMVSYFLPMLPGAHKVYSTPTRSFWCCVGTGFENQAKYGEFIYYHDASTLYVNLFIPSQIHWKEKGFKLKQTTEFPKNGTIDLYVEENNAHTNELAIRYPSWADQVEVTINGQKKKIKEKPGHYIRLKRNWKKGDHIQIVFPMKLQVNPTKDNPQIAAITYGPVVLAGRMGTEGMETPAPYSNPALYNDYYTYEYHIPADINNELHKSTEALQKDIHPTDTPLRFTIEGTDIHLAPIYDIHRERYIIYWNLTKP